MLPCYHVTIYQQRRRRRQPTQIVNGQVMVVWKDDNTHITDTTTHNNERNSRNKINLEQSHNSFEFRSQEQTTKLMNAPS